MIYRIVANGCDELFNQDCTEEEAENALYGAIDERKYQWLELRRGQADEEDVVIDSAWALVQEPGPDGRYLYQHEFRDGGREIQRILSE